MFRSVVVVALACSSLIACGPEFRPETGSDADALKGGSVRQGKKPRAEATFTARTTDSHSAGAEPTWKDAFEIDTTYGVYFAAEIEGRFSGHHTVVFELRMPDGTVYQRLEVPFATDEAAYPGEQQAEACSSGWRVWASVPVAGTMIQQYGLAGVWEVELFVDGGFAPAAAAQFTLF